MDKEKEKLVQPELEEDSGVGTAADVEEVMKKYDRESNTRIWEGWQRTAVRIIGIAFSCYCIFSTLKGWPTLPEQKLNIFLGLILIMGYLHYPIKKGITKVNYMPWYDIVLMVLVTALAAMCAVPKVLISRTSTSLPSWKKAFSKPLGTPTVRIFRTCPPFHSSWSSRGYGMLA